MDIMETFMRINGRSWWEKWIPIVDFSMILSTIKDTVVNTGFNNWLNGWTKQNEIEQSKCCKVLLFEDV